MANKKSIFGSTFSAWTLAAVLMLAILPFFILAFYVHPQADDYLFALERLHRSAFDLVRYFYSHWSGRYAAIILGSFDPWVFHNIRAYQLVLNAFMLFHLLALFFFYHHLNRQLPAVDKLVFALAAFFAELVAVPDVYEFIYWYPSVSIYGFSISLMLIFLGLTAGYIKACYSSLAYVPAAAFLLLVIAGLMELLFPFLLLGFAALLYFYRRQLNRKHLMVFGFLLLFFTAAALITMLAPGNYKRLDFNHSAASSNTMLIALEATAYLFVGLLQKPELWLMSAMAFMLAWGRVPWSSSLSPWWLAAATIALIFLLFVPLSYALGGFGSGRTFNVYALFAVALLLFNILNLTVFLQLKGYTLPNLPSKTPLIMGVFIVLLSYSQLYLSDARAFLRAPKEQKSSYLFKNSNTANALSTLLFDAQKTFKAYRHLDKQLEAAHQRGEKTVRLHYLPENARIILLRDPHQFIKEWKANFEARYYQIDSVILEE